MTHYLPTVNISNHLPNDFIFEVDTPQNVNDPYSCPTSTNIFLVSPCVKINDVIDWIVNGATVKVSTDFMMPSNISASTVYTIINVVKGTNTTFNLSTDGVNPILFASTGMNYLQFKEQKPCPFLMPLTPATQNFIAFWGDGTVSNRVTAWNDANRIHTFPALGTYTVRVSGKIGGWYTGWDGSLLCPLFKKIKQWGNYKAGASDSQFASSTYLTITAKDIPDMSTATTLESLFQGCLALTTIPNMEKWNVSNVTSLRLAFADSFQFNQPLNGWDTSKVTTIEWAFRGDSGFNQPLDLWNTSSMTNMRAAFLQSGINQDFSSWDVSKVTNMTNMFDLTPMSTVNYDKLLISWGAQSVQSGVVFAMNSTTKYTSGGAAAAARAHLISAHGWTITDGGGT